MSKQRKLSLILLLSAAITAGTTGSSMGQVPLAPAPVEGEPYEKNPDRDDIRLFPPADEAAQQTRTKHESLIREVLEPEARITIDPERSKLLRTLQPVLRFSIVDSEIVDLVQYSPTEFELIGGEAGTTTLTLWFGQAGQDTEVLRYLVEVVPTTEDDRVLEYGELQDKINELFPNSMIQLIPIADKLIVRGQARDAEEASQIMSVIRGQSTDQTGALLGPGSYGIGLNQGVAADVNPGESDLPSSNVISLLRVPGEQQVMLKVRIAELTRSALRDMGVDFSVVKDNFVISSMISGAPNITALLDSGDVNLFIKAFSSNGYSKLLAEPNLVTLSGVPASFISGGQFAVPTVVGVGGAAAATTTFQGFGTQLTFTPTVLDKDRIRLQVSPTFSTLNNGVAVNGIPGLNTRSVSTTIDMREGQWFLIAGLLQDQQEGSKGRVPGFGDIPVVDTVFSSKNIKRDETELVILVSPELVHPMEKEQVPLILPGMEVTEPGPADFFLRGRIEGDPNCDHRSTVWPIYRDSIRDAIRDAKSQARYQRSESYYIVGPHGFSR